MKLVIGHMISEYDIEFLDKKASRSFNWGSNTVPLDSTKLLFRRRGVP